MSKNEVKKADKNEIIDFDPAIFEEDAKENRNMGADDFLIPRLQVLQGLSPQVEKKRGAYIEGAEVGMMIDSVTNQLWDGDEGLICIPVFYARKYLEWLPERGGFVADHGLDQQIINSAVFDEKEKKDLLPNGNILAETCEHYIMIYNPTIGTATPIVATMAGSQVRVAKRWNSVMNQLMLPKPSNPEQVFNPAPFYCSYQLTTTIREKDKNIWFVFDFKRREEQDTILLKNGKDIYMAARDWKKQIEEGQVQAAPPAEDNQANEGAY
jgi:hypothetical protein